MQPYSIYSGIMKICLGQFGHIPGPVCLVDPSILISWRSPFPILGVSGVLLSFLFNFECVYLLANSVDPDQMPRSALFAYDQKIGCYPYMG